MAQASQTEMPQQGKEIGLRNMAVLAILGALYFASFVDRFIMASLVAPIKAELHINDIQIGLLFGTAFALFYSTLSMPFGRYADRANRRRIIVIASVAWGIATIGSGFAGSFTVLMLCRIGLAIGEAALLPAVYSLIADIFPEEKRSQAASIFTAAGFLGAGSSYMIGASLISIMAPHAVDGLVWGLEIWRVVVILVGCPPILLAIVLAGVLREPVRRPSKTKSSIEVSFLDTLKFIRDRFRTIGLRCVGTGLCLMPSYALAAWLPTYVAGRYVLDLQTAAYLVGPTKIIASTFGALVIPAITERMRRSGHKDAALACGIGATAVALGLLLAASVAPNVMAFLVLICIAIFLLGGTSVSILISFQHSVESRILGTISGFCLMCAALIGLGLGPLVFGALNELQLVKMTPGLAIAGISIVSIIPALICFVFSARDSARQHRR